jgi:hypothetical protein
MKQRRVLFFQKLLLQWREMEIKSKNKKSTSSLRK